MFELQVRQGARFVLRARLDKKNFTIGRSLQNDLSLPDEHISRFHACLTQNQHGVELTDKSSSGIWVGSRRVSGPELLKPGCVFSMGVWDVTLAQVVAAPELKTTIRLPVDGTKIVSLQEQASKVGAVLELEVQATSQLHRFKKEKIIVGSRADCDFVLDDEYVSSRHLSLEYKNGQWLAQDLDSKNGTLLGGAKLKELVLTGKTELVLGATTLIVRPKVLVDETSSDDFASLGLLGRTLAMQEVFSRIRKVAPTGHTVLIQGESGCGKELVAQAIHGVSAVAQGPYIILNCGAIAENLIESELFGHEKGAFTGAISRRLGAFEAAHRGTLFLDEIGEMPLALQAKLLRVLESKSFRRVGSSTEEVAHVRIIAATHRDLKAMVEAGQFREDLYFRLMVLPISLPPLRDRLEDISILAPYLLKAASGEKKLLSKRALDKLRTHSWPGNIRELKNVLLRTLVFSEGLTIDADDIEFFNAEELADETGLNLQKTEKAHIIEALKRTQGNKAQAADLLGIAKSTLFKRIKQFNIEG